MAATSLHLANQGTVRPIRRRVFDTNCPSHDLQRSIRATRAGDG